MIAAQSLGIRAGRRFLLRHASVTVAAGEVLAIVGPNGAGKSTLFRALTGERAPDEGSVMLDGTSLRQWQAGALARRRSVVSQGTGLAFPMTAAEVVALGRLPWHGTPRMAQDKSAVQQAMRATDTAHLGRQDYATLSGGERQRVQIARALAQIHGADAPAAILLDEPTASLDVRHSAELLHVLRRLAADGIAVAVVLHDLNEALFVADRVALIAEGECRAVGPAAAMLRPALLEAAYRLPFREVAGAIIPDLSMGNHARAI